jgi:hypothetical protein
LIEGKKERSPQSKGKRSGGGNYWPKVRYLLFVFVFYLLRDDFTILL